MMVPKIRTGDILKKIITFNELNDHDYEKTNQFRT